MQHKLDTSYVLESSTEFDRLEKQSTFPKYDYRKELKLANLNIKPGSQILDAGCGSGVVSRFLATLHADCDVLGIDLAEERLQRAKEVARNIPNLHFESGDLSEIQKDDHSLDLIISRYVLQHVNPEKRLPVLREFLRCLKPQGVVCIIDFDGAFYNLFPRLGVVDEVLTALETRGRVDLRIGRKLPSMLHEAGFRNLQWRIETIEIRDEALKQEQEMIPEKLASSLPYISELIQSQEKAEQFAKEYMAAIEAPGAVLFYNKFVVTGKKQPQLTAIK